MRTMCRRTIFLLAICLALVTGCSAQATVAPTQPAPTRTLASGTLTVFAAASLMEAFTGIGQQFEAGHPGVKVLFSFASSRVLSAQLDEGAPADLFASANTKEMNNAIAAGRVAGSSQKIFAHNKLVVIYPIDNPAGLNKLQDLANPGLKLVFAAEEVPVGKYSLEFLDKAGQDAALGTTFRDGVLKNVVSYEENVKAVLTKVVLGEADAGIVYVTDISLDNAGKVGRLDIPDALNVVATYPIAVVSDAQQPELAQAFLDLVLSVQGQQILAEYGFLPADWPVGR
jgi:molybdate transport system substrate-binding protein